MSDFQMKGGEDAERQDPAGGSSVPRSADLKREHDSVDDFEHLEHENSSLGLLDRPGSQPKREPALVDVRDESPLVDTREEEAPPRNLLDTSVPMFGNNEDQDVEDRDLPATPPPSADFERFEMENGATGRSADPFARSMQKQQVDLKAATMAFMETERSAPQPVVQNLLDFGSSEKEEMKMMEKEKEKDEMKEKEKERGEDTDFLSDIRSSVLPVPEKSPEVAFINDSGDKDSESKKKKTMEQAQSGILEADETWNVVEKDGSSQALLNEAPTKPLPPLPKEETLSEAGAVGQQSGGETGDSEFESEPEPSPAKTSGMKANAAITEKKSSDSISNERNSNLPASSTSTTTTSSNTVTAAATTTTGGRKTGQILEIAPKQIFRDMGIDALFNPDRLNPKVAALIYWRDPKKTGIVFGAILSVLLSLAYFSLISVLAYLSLLALTGTVAFRIYKTVLQAVQKTSDGHPFKDILDMNLTLPSEKVHEVADLVVAHTNATLSELRRLFLVEDLVDSLKFGVVLWCLTYLGAWFNGMTLIIVGVVGLFTLPKIYETNKAQIDQNLALVQGKVNEITAKVKAAIPLGKKPEPTKEE